ncbi:MAG: hypothetical protein QNJ15_04875 [Erythrobacter sp.]|nr:hypothetical protein [Erythrobacter sp.]
MIETIGLLAAFLAAAQAQPVNENAASEATAVDADRVEQVAREETAKVADDDDKIICRRTAIIGSKFKKKICGTKKQWETLANRGADTTRELQRRGKGLEPGDVPGT